MNKKNSRKNTENYPPNPFRTNEQSRFNWWKYLFGLLFIWIIISWFLGDFNNVNQAAISYSEFKDQAAQGNIAEVTFKGDRINGEFKNKYKKTDGKNDTISYDFFTSTKPSFEDPYLVEVLEKNNVTVKAESTEENNWLTYILIMFLPWILIIGYFIYVRRKMQGQMGSGMMGGGLFNIGKSKAKKFRKEKTGVTFNDVAGLNNAKKDLQEIIDYLKDPQKFTELGADIPKGILLMGPPGTGKTLLARATAGEADVSFFSISGSEFIEMFVGVGASRVRDMFDNAKKESPSIIFIDEIDSVGRARGAGVGGGHDEREQTLNQILSEMDGFEKNESVIVMAATNRPDVLDPALTRPGRFDRRVVLELPQKEARKKILEIHTRDVPLADNVNLENIAARTVSFSGADLQNLVNEAALLAGREKKKQVDADDFDKARDKILLGSVREEMINEEERKLIAYHEAGHALLTKLLPHTDPLQKVTIIPRGRSLGATEQVPEFERHNLKRKYLLNRITVALGGRAAEILIFNDLTNGAANDLMQVTKIARHMVCHWGMSDKVGPVYFKKGEEHIFLGKEMTEQRDFSEHSSKIIDEEIQRIIKECEEKAYNLLKENKIKLEAIADALMQNETLDKKQIDWILDKVSGKNSDSTFENEFENTVKHKSQDAD